MPQIAQLSETFSSQVFWMLVSRPRFLRHRRGMVPKVMGTVGSARSRKLPAISPLPAQRAIQPIRGKRRGAGKRLTTALPHKA